VETLKVLRPQVVKPVAADTWDQVHIDPGAIALIGALFHKWPGEVFVHDSSSDPKSIGSLFHGKDERQSDLLIILKAMPGWTSGLPRTRVWGLGFGPQGGLWRHFVIRFAYP